MFATPLLSVVMAWPGRASAAGRCMPDTERVPNWDVRKPAGESQGPVAGVTLALT